MKYHYLNVLLFISYLLFGHLVPHFVHIIGVNCILVIDECTTLVLYIIYTGQPSFSLIFIFSCSNLCIWPLCLKFYFSYSNLCIWPLCLKFYLVCNLNIPLQCLVYLVLAFILFCHILPKCC